jgi:putative pyruvate formate lyase activating enzyme
MGMSMPTYAGLHKKGVLAERIKAAQRMLQECTLCPRLCKVDRYTDDSGVCGTDALPVVSAHHPHFGEESPLVGRRGSGTIFMTSCNLRCVFCQNWEISHQMEGREISVQRLAEMMLELQESGCHNVNFVTPSHMVPQILSALPVAIESGLSVPLVYNTSGYDRVETIELLEGVFDIYMPDVKYLDSACAQRYSAAEDYPEAVKSALREMHRQVGDLQLDDQGIAIKGLLVRHLVMPGGVAGTRKVMRFLAREISAHTYVNLMDQYRPCGQACYYPEIARPVNPEEFEQALEAAKQEGIYRLDSEAGMRFRLF